jgi:hypothetical protein
VLSAVAATAGVPTAHASIATKRIDPFTAHRPHATIERLGNPCGQDLPQLA